MAEHAWDLYESSKKKMLGHVFQDQVTTMVETNQGLQSSHEHLGIRKNSEKIVTEYLIWAQGCTVSHE
jgi:hypothetical protein